MRKFVWILLGIALWQSQAHAIVWEFFGKGSASKNNISQNSYVLNITGAGGVAISLFPRVRVEGRYTSASSLQNLLEVSSGSVLGTLYDIKTTTSVYSAGLDITLLNEKSIFQPFIYIGMGYIETERSYFFVLAGAPTSNYLVEPKVTGISGNLGGGFRLRVARTLSIEVEAFAYAMNPHKPNPLINLNGTLGLRLYL